MTTHMLRTVMVAAAITFTAAAASAQEPTPFHGQKFLGSMHQSPHNGIAEQVSRLDERIAMLKTDMRMFAGEMKIQVMTELIEALIERQYLIERSMRPMRDMMDEWLPRTARPESPQAVPDPEDVEPEAMCSPYI
jgi:hypothetical protein